MCLRKVGLNKFLSIDLMLLSVMLLHTGREFEYLAHRVPTHLVYYVPTILPLLQISPTSTQLVT
jgi:hypothetical protein